MKRLLIAILSACALIALALIASSVVGMATLSVFNWLPMPVPYYVAATFGLAAFYIVLGIGAKRMANKGFF
jgi:uncharacterized membrane protein